MNKLNEMNETLIKQNHRRSFLNDLKYVMDKHNASFSCEYDYGNLILSYDLDDKYCPQRDVYLSNSHYIVELESCDIEDLIDKENNK